MLRAGAGKTLFFQIYLSESAVDSSTQKLHSFGQKPQMICYLLVLIVMPRFVTL